MAKPKIKKTKANKAKEKKKQIKRCDKLWSEIVKHLWNNKCAIEGCDRAGLSAHHFFGKKAHPSTRYDINNGVYLCFYHHIQKCHRENDTEPVRQALIGRIGKEFEKLYQRSNKISEHTLDEQEAILNSIWSHIEEIKGNI